VPAANNNITSAGTHTVTVTDANGCTDTESIAVTVNNTPPTASVGSGFTKTCTSNTSGNTIGASGTSGVTYAWTPASGLSSATAANPTANPSSTTTYTLIATQTSNGCTATNAVTVTVDITPPTVDAGTFTDVCDQANGQLNGSTNGVTAESATDGNTSNTGTGNFANNGRGFKFTPQINMTITEIGKRIPNTSGNYTWVLWDLNTQAALHTQAFTTNGTAGNYHYEAITSPINLTAGTAYVLSLYCDAT
jgi:hypothetical protein